MTNAINLKPALTNKIGLTITGTGGDYWLDRMNWNLLDRRGTCAKTLTDLERWIADREEQEAIHAEFC